MIGLNYDDLRRHLAEGRWLKRHGSQSALARWESRDRGLKRRCKTAGRGWELAFTVGQIEREMDREAPSTA
jgi:hypothetical protein